jgi:hypothetical protein
MMLTKISTAQPKPETVMQDQNMSGSRSAAWFSPSIKLGCHVEKWTKTPVAMSKVATVNQIYGLGGGEKVICMQAYEGEQAQSLPNKSRV